MNTTDRGQRRLWGLTVEEIHDRYWQSRGLTVIRRGGQAPSRPSDWYLLLDRDVMILAEMAPVLDSMYWSRHKLTVARVKSGHRDTGSRHRVTAAADGRVRFEPLNERTAQQPRMMLTSLADVAETWRTADSVASATDRVMEIVPADRRGSESVKAEIFRSDDPESAARFARQLSRSWHQPTPAVAGVRQVDDEVWADEDSTVEDSVQLLGPVWVGAGRRLTGDQAVLGPAILWDVVDRQGTTNHEEYDGYAPALEKRAARRVMVHVERVSQMTWAVKRAMDICGAAFGLLLMLPFIPLIMAAIWIEDGRPFFFGHKRESKGGREFYCWKFRSMRRNAEEIKRQLANEVDGPQFFMRNDPRLTKVGRFLRVTNLDEIPQLWNVLVGDMSLVGPRPSPRNENQHFPAWREARLSVRPGLSGLWQIERTRAPGVDFQEWVKYDLEYVQRMSVRTDLVIILRTIPKVLKGGGNGR